MGVNMRFSAVIKLLVLVVVGLVLLYVGQSAFKHLRIDLTEDKLFTLSQGSRNIVADLEQPLELLFFYSETAMREAPTLRNYALRIENTLEEFELLSGGMLQLRLVDPEPFSEMEDKATELGMQAVPLRVGGAQLYLGLAVSSDAGNQEVIEFFHPSRKQFLEYDIAKAIYLASRQAPPKLGLISGLPVNGGVDMATRSMNQPWSAVQQLKQLYELVDLGAGPDVIGEDIDLLLIIHPANLAEPAQYAIDQFVLSGRNAIIFVDPYAETADPGPGAMPVRDPTPLDSNLPRLFTAWGVEMVPAKVLGDAAHAMLVNIGDHLPPARNLTLLGFSEENIAKEELVTQKLDTLNLASAGVWRKLEGVDTQWTELLWSSKAAGLLDVEKVRTLMDPNRLFDSFVPDGRNHVVAGQLSGTVNTAFPDGKPVSSPGDGPSDDDSSQAQELSSAIGRGEINVLLVADTDLLTDRLWVQKQSFFGEPLLSPFADNGSLLINAADYLAGSADLISIRSRGTYDRPFTRVHEIQRQAEEGYRETADELAAQLKATEAKLTELQQSKTGAEAQVLNAEQEQAVDEFLAQKLSIRKSLREVQHQLTRDIEALGTRLKLINIGLIPLLLTLLVLLLALTRRLRQ